MPEPIEQIDDGVRIRIRLAPKASRDQIMGIHNDAIKIAITAPPVDGKANAHLIKLLSKKLKVAKGHITIISGELARDKVVQVEAIDIETAGAALGYPLP